MLAPAKPQIKPPAKAKPSPPLAISSFSILGLQDEPVLTEPTEETQEERFAKEPSHDHGRGVDSSHSASYLLEDDEPRASRWRLYTVLAMLVISAGALAWQWKRDGAPWMFFVTTSNSESHAAPAREAEATGKPVATAAAVTTTTAPAAPAETTVAPDNTETPLRQSLPEKQLAAAAPEGKPASAPPPQTGNAPESAAPHDGTPGSVTDAKPAAAPPASSNPGDSQAVPVAPPAAVSADAAEQLFEEGQKYLYGDGVDKDCGLALQDLRQSARINAEAASLLGTMYASGHCVGRNLAPAYHWYARALHRDPTNARYQSDLTVLWNQMTPAEKQAALRIAP